ncbi:MAG: hydroxymethylglutaryl-CoA reductase [Thermoanaerobaculia bacterium]|nr:hydroxymethylglutaryl-CoA reductase [Thermoanaerobaculia bacterium]
MERIELIPRFERQGYEDDQVAARRTWLEAKTGVALPLVGAASAAGGRWRGNIENPIGAAQVPIGIAGPLRVLGEHAEGEVFVPLATTEGALVRSYERGMIAITRSGGATVRLFRDENRVTPVFVCRNGAAAVALARELPGRLAELQAAVATTTRHGQLLRVEAMPSGRRVLAAFCYSTGDAHGMNMIVKATDAACQVVLAADRAGGDPVIERHLIFSGACGEKRAAGALLAGGKGKHVTASVVLPRRVLRAVLRVTAGQMEELWRLTVLGHLHTAAMGYNGHAANALAALFIACGQDVANIVNSAVSITAFEEVGEGDLAASVELPALTVATVGGGTGVGTGRECLELLGCYGTGKAKRLAEIVAATVLAGEISLGAAIASGEFVAAHEEYGRNRPDDGPNEPQGGQG